MEPKITMGSNENNKKITLHTSKQRRGIEKKPIKVTKEIQNQNQNHSSIEWRSHRVRPVTNKKEPRKWNRSLLFSILGAILVGVVLGSSILTIFFSDQPTYSNKSIDSHLQSGVSQSEYPVLRTYLLQAGNFQKKVGAQDKVAEYQEQEISAIVSNQAPYNVYIGVSGEQSTASQLADVYKNKGINVYIKEQNIQPKQKPAGPEIVQMIQQSHQLFIKLNQAVITGLNSAQPLVFDDQLEQTYQQWQTAIKQGKPAIAENKHIQEMNQALEQAVQQSKKAQQSPTAADYEAVVESLLQYVMTYDKLAHEQS